jgi:ribosome-binding protein aMBF1 (putative translation factor)
VVVSDASSRRGRPQTKKGELTVSNERYTNEEIRKRKGTVDHAKVREATEDQIADWKREDGYGDDSVLGPVRAVPPLTDVRALRERLNLSQEDFATRYMLSLRTVQEWEQGRREPTEAARVLLYAIAQDPSAIARVLHPDAA